MKNRVITVSLTIALSIFLSGAVALAQGTAVKIGFIDLREIIQASDAGKQAAAEFKKALEKKKTTIQQAEADLKKMKDALDKQRAVLKEDTVKERELEIQKHYRDYQRLVNDAKEELSARDQQLGQKLIPEILKIVNGVGEKEGFTLILDVSTVAYHAAGQNITKRIIAELNRHEAAPSAPAKNSKK